MKNRAQKSCRSGACNGCNAHAHVKWEIMHTVFKTRGLFTSHYFGAGGVAKLWHMMILGAGGGFAYLVSQWWRHLWTTPQWRWRHRQQKHKVGDIEFQTVQFNVISMTTQTCNIPNGCKYTPHAHLNARHLQRKNCITTYRQWRLCRGFA